MSRLCCQRAASVSVSDCFVTLNKHPGMFRIVFGRLGLFRAHSDRVCVRAVGAARGKALDRPS